MKTYNRLLLILAASLVLSSIVAPFVMFLIEQLKAHYAPAAEMLDYPFHRVMSRIVLISTILILILQRKKLKIGSPRSMGLGRPPHWKSLLLKGWVYGFVSLSVMIFVMVLLGSRRTEIGYESGGELIYELVKIFITGIVVAVIEEIFFRGFILQSLLRDLGRGTAVFWTSFFFAIVHFFKAPDMPETSGFNALIGFQSLFYFFQPLLSPTEVIPGFIGLFLVGTVLAYARLWTGSLYIAIGLHAGWVFVIKAEGLFLDRLNVVAPWFFGDGWVVTGIFGWIMALVILAILYVQVGRRPDNRT